MGFQLEVFGSECQFSSAGTIDLRINFLQPKLIVVETSGRHFDDNIILSR